MTPRPKTTVYWVGFVVPKALFGHPPHDPILFAKPCIVRAEVGQSVRAVSACVAAAHDHLRRPIVVALTDLRTVIHTPALATAYDKLISIPASHPIHKRISYLARSALHAMAQSNVIPGPGYGGVFLGEWSWPSTDHSPNPDPDSKPHHEAKAP